MNGDIALEQAEAAMRAADHPEPPTTMRHPTFHRGATVTAATIGDPVCEVDGLPAYNWTGHDLAVNDVVLLAVDQGARMVVGVATIK